STGTVVRLNNSDGFLVSIRGLTSTGVSSATDPTGRRWIQAGRGLVVTSKPIAFSGRIVGARTISYPGVSPIAWLTSTNAGESTDTLRLPASFVSPATGDGYLQGQLPSIEAVDASGSVMDLVPTTITGGAGIMNAQAYYTNGPRLDGIRVDNSPPPPAKFSIVSTTALNNVNNWVSGSYKFTSGVTGIVADPGVGLFGSNTAPTPESAGLSVLVVGGTLTDTTEASTGAQLPPSGSNTTYTAVIRYADRLGNTQTVPLSGAGVHPRASFGVDLQPPTLRCTSGALTGKTLISAFSDSVFASPTGLLGPRAFAVDAIDDRSGLADGRVGASLVRFSQPNPTGTFLGTKTCVVGTGGC